MKTDAGIVTGFFRTMPFFACVLLGGCFGEDSDAPELGSVSGTVTLDEKPLEGAMVTFQPENGRPAYAVTDSSGYYELRYTADTNGAMVGKHLVSIGTYRQGDPEAEEPELRETRPERVPTQYNVKAVDNPEMTVEVKAGSNTFDFALKSEGEIIQPALSDEGC